MKDSANRCPDAHIIGCGSYLPQRILTNFDLEKLVDTSDEWIVSRTGMKERRIAASEEGASDMGARAAKKALDQANLAISDVDLILVATLSSDYIFPSTACVIQEKLGARNAAAMDIGAACSGMIYTLSVAKSYVVSQEYQNILVIGCEKVSSFIDYKDRNTCVLFGDGASAFVVSAEKKGLKMGPIVLGADGKGKDFLSVPAGGSLKPVSAETLAAREHFLQMDGREVFRHAVRHMEASARSCLEKAGLLSEDVTYFIPHQANFRMMESLAKRLAIKEERMVSTIAETGNTCAASIGIAFDSLMAEKSLKIGDHLLFVVAGAGLTWGAMVASCVTAPLGEQPCIRELVSEAVDG